MAINLTTAEQEYLADQTKRDPAVIMSFYEWYARFRQSAPDSVTACRLALRKQEEAFRQAYEDKAAWYVKAVRKDYRARLLNLKRLRTGPWFQTRSGIRVRSKAEKIIADFLTARGVRFEYEPVVDLGGYYVMPDFGLTEHDVYLEHFGVDTPKYRHSAEAKLDRYRRFGVTVVCTCPADEPDIEAVLTQKLREAGVAVSIS